MIGKHIDDRYYVEELLGEGGMAKVYLANDEKDNKKVAIKMIRDETSIEPLNIARFQREAKAYSALNHPNIVKIYDIGEYESKPYMVMEYIESENLKNIIKNRGRFSVNEALTIMHQLADALDHVHNEGVVHRDVKPQNIMVLHDGNIKLADFGIALIKDAPDITQKDFVIGSIHYLAPEIVNGKKATFTGDIYALGITFFELLLGKQPFANATVNEIVSKHLHEPIPSVRKEHPDIPKKVEKIIYKACQKKEENRFSSMREFKRAIEDCMRVKIEFSFFGFLKNIFKKDNK